MDIQLIQELLGWGSLINFALLTLWGGMILFAHDFVYQIHNSFFDLSEERFNAIHYGGMIFYKVAIFMFYLIPYMAICIAV